jgi:hypothetical protein
VALFAQQVLSELARDVEGKDAAESASYKKAA